MRGSKREKRPGVWELRVFRGRDPLNGRKLYLSRTFRGTKRGAEGALAELVVAMADGGGRGTQAKTLGELIERYLGEIDVAPTTLADYRTVARLHVFPALGKLPLRRVGAADLDRLYRALRKSPADGGKGLSAARIRHVHAIISGALRQAVRWGWLTRNPARDASPPQAYSRRITPPSPSDVARALAAAEESDPELAAALRLAVATGARRGEVCGIRRTDLDLGRGLVAIRRSVAALKHSVIVKDTKTHAERTLAIDHATVVVLARHLAEMEARATAADSRLLDDHYLFSSCLDGSDPWRPDRLTAGWNRIRTVTGLESHRLHDLRHLQATTLLNAGVPVKTVSGRLGHANAATTLNVYSHSHPDLDRAAAELLGEVLDKALCRESESNPAEEVAKRGRKASRRSLAHLPPSPS